MRAEPSVSSYATLSELHGSKVTDEPKKKKWGQRQTKKPTTLTNVATYRPQKVLLCSKPAGRSAK